MIEVLAAMVIFSTSAVVLFGWIGQTADRLARLSVEQQQLFGELATLEYLRGLNPMVNQTGSVTLDGVELSWSTTPIGEEEPVQGAFGGPGNYVVRLYKVQVRMHQSRAGPSQQAFYLAGWRQTTEVRRELPFKL